MAQNMSFLQTGTGRITAQPDEIDEIATSAWTKVYEGNAENHESLVANFLQQYRQYIYVSPQPQTVPKFTKEMILEDCESAPCTAPGWDQWTGQDWQLLSGEAAQRLADLLNGIESGLDWPEPTHWGKAHFF